MQITQIAENIRRNIGRMALMGALAAVMITALAACGSSATGTDSGSNPTATAAASEPTATPMSSDSSAAPTDTPGNADIMSEAPTQTPASTNNDAATPTQATAGQASGSGSGSATQINATLREWAIDLSQKEVPAGKVQFTVNNQGRMAHNLTVLDSNGTQIGQTPIFGSSEGPQTLEVSLTSGTYTVICSLPGHAQRGQMAQLVVK